MEQVYQSVVFSGDCTISQGLVLQEIDPGTKPVKTGARAARLFPCQARSRALISII
jgi:hypothetical protein